MKVDIFDVRVMSRRNKEIGCIVLSSLLIMCSFESSEPDRMSSAVPGTLHYACLAVISLMQTWLIFSSLKIQHLAFTFTVEYPGSEIDLSVCLLNMAG